MARPMVDAAEAIAVHHGATLARVTSSVNSLDDEKKEMERQHDARVHEAGETEELASAFDADYPSPEQQEGPNKLKRVAGAIPYTAFLIVLVEGAERMSYYGCQGVYTNFIQRPLPVGSTTGADPLQVQAGALGMGQRASTGLTTLNTFLVYLLPIWGAILADTKWGRFKAICIFAVVCLVGHIVLVIAALPPVLADSKGALAAFIIALLIIAAGTGGIKANVSTMVADQCTDGQLRVKTLRNGDKVITDPALTIQKVFLWFYFAINVGSFFSIGTSYSARNVGFWLAYLVPTIGFLAAPVALYLGRNKFVKIAPRGSVILEAWRVFRVSSKSVVSWNPIKTARNIKGTDFWAPAKPSTYDRQVDGPGRPSWLTWDEEFVLEVKRTFAACKVFFYFYWLYWLSYNQISNNLVSQASSMRLDGVPNDVLNNLNPLALIIFIPIMDKLVYPTLRRFGINFTPLKRITFGFMINACAMAYSAIIQSQIYKTSPCGTSATTCETPSPYSVWLQTPSYMLVGISEIFASITGLEYAYTKAPVRMKSLVMALFLLQNAWAAAIGQALTVVSEDPYLTWNYTACAAATGLGGIAFWFSFRKLDAQEVELNQIGTGKREGFADEQEQK